MSPRVCPLCGREYEAHQALPGEVPGTERCPGCGQEHDQPAAAGDIPAAPSLLEEGPGAAAETAAAATPPPAPAETPSPAPEPGGPAARPPAAEPAWGSEGEAWLRHELAGDPTSPGSPPPPASPPVWTGPAWEGPGGYLGTFFRTLRQMHTSPRATLTAAPGQAGAAWPLGFGLVVSTLGLAVGQFWDQVFGTSQLGPDESLIIVALSPLFVLLGLCLSAVFVALGLSIVRGNKNGFRATFRAVCYGNAPSVWYLIPLVGMVVGFLWTMVSQVGALAGAHGISPGRAFAAMILVPLMLGVPAVIIALVLVYFS
ncbi:MAG: YIP1 family protein [Deltaproteobacteria bacterium]|nr:YIP1 family protein [Deltaproteobacteria bacterium]